MYFRNATIKRAFIRSDCTTKSMFFLPRKLLSRNLEWPRPRRPQNYDKSWSTHFGGWICRALFKSAIYARLDLAAFRFRMDKAWSRRQQPQRPSSKRMQWGKFLVLSDSGANQGNFFRCNFPAPSHPDLSSSDNNPRGLRQDGGPQIHGLNFLKLIVFAVVAVRWQGPRRRRRFSGPPQTFTGSSWRGGGGGKSSAAAASAVASIYCRITLYTSI